MLILLTVKPPGLQQCCWSIFRMCRLKHSIFLYQIILKSGLWLRHFLMSQMTGER
ncbi:hypothetical protein SB6412_05332 [Klebsiella pasteurii]|nr:hypothetical protein SB6412_05332 [Klebsiella pasteurii]